MRSYRMNVRFFIICLCLFLAGMPAQARSPGSENDETIVFGILPFVSPFALAKRFAPLRIYLEQQIGQPVRIVSASSYPDFVDRTANGQYDIVLTAPHFVLLALDSGKYTLGASYLKPLSAHVVVARDSHVRSTLDLANELIALPPKQAIISTIGEELLANRGLVDGKAPILQYYSSHNSAYHAVVTGKAAAAIISVNVLNMALKNGAAIRVIDRSKDFPGLGILTARHLPADLQKKISDILVTMKDTPEGKLVLQQIDYPGYRYSDPESFEMLRYYLDKNQKNAAKTGIRP